MWQSEVVSLGDVFRSYLEVGLGAGPTNIFAFDLDAPPASRALSAGVAVKGGEVTIVIDVDDVDLRFVRDDTSGATAHPHAYVDRDPPTQGDFVASGRDDVVHADGDTIVSPCHRVTTSCGSCSPTKWTAWWFRLSRSVSR